MTLGVMPLHAVESMRLAERRSTSSLSEADLLAGYGEAGGELLVEPCLCGSSIVCERGAIASAVRAHNATPGHAAWAIAAGWR
jgi:hypothetical protein